MKTTRTDIHRPGAIIPAHYQYLLSYNLPTSSEGWPIPAFGINCEIDRRQVDAKTGAFIAHGTHHPSGRCCLVGLRTIANLKFAATGGTGKCSVCSTNYVYGDVWQHTLTGECIHIGHNCADKYDLLSDRSEWELQHGRALAAAAAQIQKQQNREAREKFLTANPGLAEALTGDHNILRDLSDKLTKYHSLSEKQVALAFKLATELKTPKVEEQHIPAPTGNAIKFRGVVVSLKLHEGSFGPQMKMTVKVTTPEGSWLAWGTAPTSLLDGNDIKGQTVELVANLIHGGQNDHFVFMKRPRNAVRITEVTQ